MNPSYVTTGVAGGSTTIQVDVANGIGSAVPIAVTLSENYVLASPRPPGFPSRPSMTGAAAPNLDYPGETVLSGTRIFLLACEAAALVAAGAASHS
jgi:hypothetical protein